MKPVPPTNSEEILENGLSPLDGILPKDPSFGKMDENLADLLQKKDKQPVMMNGISNDYSKVNGDSTNNIQMGKRGPQDLDGLPAPKKAAVVVTNQPMTNGLPNGGSGGQQQIVQVNGNTNGQQVKILPGGQVVLQQQNALPGQQQQQQQPQIIQTSNGQFYLKAATTNGPTAPGAGGGMVVQQAQQVINQQGKAVLVINNQPQDHQQQQQQVVKQVINTPTGQQIVSRVVMPAGAPTPPPPGATVVVSHHNNSTTTQQHNTVLTSNGIDPNNSNAAATVLVTRQANSSTPPLLLTNGDASHGTVARASPTPPLNNSIASLPPQQPSTQQQPVKIDPSRPFLCEWAGCMKAFKTPKEVERHAIAEHCPLRLEGTDIPCLWARCDGMKRKRYSLMTHFQDRHCHPQVGILRIRDPLLLIIWSVCHYVYLFFAKLWFYLLILRSYQFLFSV